MAASIVKAVRRPAPGAGAPSAHGGAFMRAALWGVAGLGLSGCAVRGATSYSLFGAFFPAWMFCALAGIVGAAVARIGFVASGLSRVMPFQLFVCTSIGLVIALVAWLAWFGR